MNKSYVSLVNKEFAGREVLYLKDPKSDMFAILNEKIYPLHKSFLTEAQYFAMPISSNEKVHMLDPALDQKSFQKIIGYFYGKELQFLRNWDLIKLLDAITILNIPSLFKKILNDIKTNFEDYGFFLVMVIGHKFNIKWLKQQCEQQLLLMGFQQLNFNRYDLLQVDDSMLAQVIKLHELLKINQNIVGLKQNQIRKIIKEYCKANNISEQKQNYLNSLIVSSESKVTKIDYIEDLAHKTSSTEIQQKNFNQSTKSRGGYPKTLDDIKSDQVNQLRDINTKIQQKNTKMFEQIKNVKSSIQSSMKLQSKQSGTEHIDEKFKKFEKTCQEQDEKYLNLKKQMDKLNPSGKKSEQSDADYSIKPIGSSTGSTKDNEQKSTRSRKLSQTIDKKLVFPEMPRLTRDLD